MLPLLLNGRPLHVPTSWADVTTARYVAWAGAGPDPLASVAALLGIDAEELGRTADADAALLLGPLAFVSEPLPELPPVPVGGEAYLAVEEARAALRTAYAAGREADALPAVWARLTQRRRARVLRPGAEYDQAAARRLEARAMGLPCTEVIPEARALVAGLAAFFERHAELFEPSADDEVAEEAGVERFAKYGHLAPVIALAGTNPVGWQAVYQQPAESVYWALRFRRDTSEYQKDLAEVMASRSNSTTT